MPAVNDKLYKIRSFVNGKRMDGKPFYNFSLTIPVEIAEKLPDDMRFSCELTDEGILFRPSTHTDENTIALPAWAVQSKNGSRR